MIRVMCIGKIKESYIKDMIDDYYSRINKYHKIEIVELPEEFTIIKEGQTLLNKINDKTHLIVCDIQGKTYNSVEFSGIIEKAFIHSSDIVFVIGSSLGVSKEVLDRANDVVSFSSLTFPHGLFRAMLLEQIYRAYKIINNESYHK